MILTDTTNKMAAAVTKLLDIDQGEYGSSDFCRATAGVLGRALDEFLTDFETNLLAKVDNLDPRERALVLSAFGPEYR